MNVLIVEDKEDDALLIMHELEKGGYEGHFKQVDSEETMKQALHEMQWDIVLSDFNIPSFNAFASLELIKSTKIDLPFIVISGSVGEETAVKLMREGAKDFILKQNLKRLLPVIDRETRELQNRIAKDKAEIDLKEQISQNENLGRLQEVLIIRQEELVSKEIELVRSNQYLDQFANMASHDLKEPLRMIKQYIMLLEKRYKGKLDSDADEFIAFCVDAIERMEHMIQSILGYAKLNKLDVYEEIARCDVALENAKKNLMVAIQNSQAEITNDNLPVVKMNSVKLTQIFQNLLSNAIKYHTENNLVKIHIGIENNEKNWIFCINDNGIGIKSENFEKIFLPFQRLNNTRKYEGIGLGLSFCKKIIEQYGGKIWVESELGKKTTFFFTIVK